MPQVKFYKKMDGHGKSAKKAAKLKWVKKGSRSLLAEVISKRETYLLSQPLKSII